MTENNLQAAVSAGVLSAEGEHRALLQSVVEVARAIFKDIPEYDYYWHLPGIKFGRRVVMNYNKLIALYPGADGMKTGFICSAGFNVVASATRSGRHLITVVLGAQSANERTIKAAELFDRGFSSKVNFTNPELAALPVSSNTTPPTFG